MNSNRKVILNPVLPAPWGLPTQLQVYKNSKGCPENHWRKRKKSDKPMQIKLRNENIEILKKRFPDLKKYQARAALTITNNELDKAIILLEINNSYRKETSNKSGSYLKNIQINLSYTIDLSSSDGNNNYIDFNWPNENINNKEDKEKHRGTAIVKPLLPPRDSNISKKVGVVISKTLDGYKAAML